MAPGSGPQRSLESPLQQPRGHAHHAAFFQRQDSCPAGMRDRGRGAGPTQFHAAIAATPLDPAVAYPDVSQITAVQVTPRPKPRAFPRTNPSYLGVHRRDAGAAGNSQLAGNSPVAAFRHVDTMAASVAFNHGYQLPARAGGPDRGAPGAGRYYPSPSGAQTLQTSHSYFRSGHQRTDRVHDDGIHGDGFRGNDRGDADSDSSMSSSSSDGDAAGGGGLRRQSTLDDRRPPAPRPAAATDQSETPAGRSGVAGLVGISVAASSRHSGGGPAAVEQSRSTESSPLVDQGPRRRPQRNPRQPKSEPEIAAAAPARTVAIPNGVVRPPTARRNSEPDYVNVPSKSDPPPPPLPREGIVVSGSAQSAVPAEQSQNPAGALVERNSADETPPRSGDGTLRIRDHVSPAADYVNCQDIVIANSGIALYFTG